MVSMMSIFSPRNFKEKYQSFSVAMLSGNRRDDVDRGGKIIMPPSSLELLSRLNVTYPMMFRLSNERKKRTSHSGVLEFIADEGMVFLPNWMMKNLLLEEGDILEVEYTTLPVATFSRFQPQSTDFLDIHNPKAVLENTLRQFACLTTGDVINIRYNDKDYELSVLETEPGDAVSIIECDMNVDFAPPEGYQETGRTNKETPEEEEEVERASFLPFTGEGYRLDGKKRKQSSGEMKRAKTVQRQRGVPDLDWKVGTLQFMRSCKQTPVQAEKPPEPGFQIFSGKGHSLWQNSEDSQ